MRPCYQMDCCCVALVALARAAEACTSCRSTSACASAIVISLRESDVRACGSGGSGWGGAHGDHRLFQSARAAAATRRHGFGGAVLRGAHQACAQMADELTRFLTDDGHFPRWHYRRDPTHVCFWQPATFQWLARPATTPRGQRAPASAPPPWADRAALSAASQSAGSCTPAQCQGQPRLGS